MFIHNTVRTLLTFQLANLPKAGTYNALQLRDVRKVSCTDMLTESFHLLAVLNLEGTEAFCLRQLQARRAPFPVEG